MSAVKTVSYRCPKCRSETRVAYLRGGAEGKPTTETRDDARPCAMCRAAPPRAAR